MKRRSLLLASGASAILSATRTQAQAQSLPPKIGWLSIGKRDSNNPGSSFTAFMTKLKELGFVEGRDFVIERRWAAGELEELRDHSRTIVAVKPALIVAAASPTVAAFQKETTTIPILFANVGEPVEQGFVASLARPGGNLTGTTFRFELMRKLPELVRDTLPDVRRLALLEDERYKVSKRVTMRIGEAANALGYKLDVIHAGAGEFERAFAGLARTKAQVLLLPPQYVAHGVKIASLAMKAKLPTFGNYIEYARDGALMSIYTDAAEGYERIAVMASKILKGAKPADLPVEEPERMYLAVNMRTAKSLGIKIPQSVLVRADKVIE